MKINFGVHLGFAITRYPEPDQWAKLVREELDISHVQFVSDLLPPELNDDIIEEQIKKINDCANKYQIKIDNTFTSPRYNFIAHPDKKISDYWFNWLKKFILISSKLKSKGTGSVLGIYSVESFKKNNGICDDYLIDKWKELSVYAAENNLEYLIWEPMSVKRELGETIKKTQDLHKRLNNEGSGVPIKICFDVDHGDVTSKNHEDLDPYTWLRRIGNHSPVLHMKQRTKNVHGHKPFTNEYNKEGLIYPKRIIEELKKLDLQEVYIYLELSFREREPYDSNVVNVLKESINYWKRFL